jgi:hypothetical protein
MKVRGGRLDPLLCRQRLSRLLDEADITLDGFPRSAIVCLRRVRTTVDDVLLNSSYVRGSREGWRRQIRTSVEQVARRAYRPARDVVPTMADAVWFADQAELLACLAYDWCTGTASLHWWWKGLFRGGDYVKAILDSWREFPQYIPGTLLHLANNGKVVPFVRMVSASDTQTVLDRMMSVFALPELRAAIGTEVWSNYDSGVEHVVVQEAMSTRIPQPAPWQRWIAEGQWSDLRVKQQCLIGVGLMLHRAPSVVRTSQFAQALAEWTRRPVKQLPSIAEQVQERPREARQAERQTLNPRFKPPIIPAQADDHALCPANVPEATESSSVDAPPIDSDVQPLAGQRTSIPSLSCVAADPREIGGERKTIDADSIVEGVSPVERATPTQRLIPQAHAEQHSLSRRQTAPLQARSAGSETESTAFLLAEASIDTAFGGVFYLMNLALYLKLYGDFSTPLQPGIALSPWDFLALVSEQLVGKRIHADPVWPLLAELTGRQEDDLPGQGFELSAEWRSNMMKQWGQTPLPGEQSASSPFIDWLMPFLCARLVQALGLDHEHELSKVLCEHHAKVYVTATHVDVLFLLAELPIAVRIAGLDRNPGWIPAAGRYMAFHFS